MAFARGVQEMLLRGAPGDIVVFPAVPREWRGKVVSFRDLLVPGGHRVSARLAPNGDVRGSITGFSDVSLAVVLPGGARKALRLKTGVAMGF